MGNTLVTSVNDHQINQSDLGKEISRILKNKKGVSNIIQFQIQIKLN